MAKAKNPEPQYEMIIRDGYMEFPLPEGIKRKITSGKWGTPTGDYSPRTASRKRK